MKLINYSVVVVTLFFFTSCQKELSLELGNVNASKAKLFQDFIVTNKFQLKAFYSDIPIDYITTDDTIKQETNLWSYVSNYLKDDYNIFMPGSTDITIDQNAIKMPGLEDSVLHKKYQITYDDNGVHLLFLDYQYNPLTYNLNKIGPDYFILSVKWNHGATLFSRFERIP